MAQYSQALLLGPWISMRGSRKMGVVMPKPTQADLAFLIGLVETGRVTPVIDRCYPLNKVPDAIRYVEEGRAQGKVVITVEHGDNA